MVLAAMAALAGCGSSAPETLRGSTAPAGQSLPSLVIEANIRPPLPERSKLTGRPLVLGFVCGRCPSTALGRRAAALLGDHQSIGQANVHLLAEQPLALMGSDNVTIHRVPVNAYAQLRSRFFLGPDAVTLFVYDAQLQWRSTFHAGQIQIDDIAHDVAGLADEHR